jgi:SAM-dependent methyltransferase
LQPAGFICPACTQPLAVASDQLSCSGCKATFPVTNSIPRFVTDDHLESFGRQWTKYEVAHDHEDQATFVAKTGMQLTELSGLKVLDAGCGGGRYSKVCGEAGAQVFGADHTRAVDKARELCQHLPNVRFVQADLKALPFPEGSFDFAFSIGVMHHDANTRAVFESVAKMVRPGGRLAVWLYRKNQNWQEAINSWLRNRTSKMPPAKLEKWCVWGARAGGVPIFNRLANKVVNFSAHPSFENRVCDTFDWWAPQYQYHHTVAELLDWFETAGFSQLQVLPPEKTGLVYRWIYEQNLLIGSGVNVQGTKPKHA